MDERAVRKFWQEHACGDAQIGGLRERYDGDYEEFFAEYDRFRYRNERHLAECLDALDVAGRQLLEIGLGEGADSERLIRRGARWSGVDLTAESVARVRTRLTLRGLPHDELRQASVLELPFADSSFDVVFSHGVLHHVPDIHRAQKEIHRVLRPNGELVIMVYARRSLNYLVSIGVIRRIALLGALPLAHVGRVQSAPWRRMLAAHADNAKRTGMFRYLRLAEFVHHNTDGPENPYSVVYDRRRIERNFPSFRIVRTYQRFMHAPPLPLHRLPGEAILGWHLWVHMEPLDEQTSAGGGARSFRAASIRS